MEILIRKEYIFLFMELFVVYVTINNYKNFYLYYKSYLILNLNIYYQ